MATSPTPIVEKMALFWHGLFTSSVDKMYPRLVFKQIRTYRPLALGDLHDLAQAMALDPGDAPLPRQRVERRRQPERELRPGADGAVPPRPGQLQPRPTSPRWPGPGPATATTRPPRPTSGTPARHDSGAKTIFGITRNWDGPETITEMVRGSKQAVCARFIAGKLWAFLAGPAPAAGDPRRAGRRLRRLRHGHQGARAGDVPPPRVPGPGHPHRPRAQPGRVDGRGDAGARAERGDAPPRVVGRAVRPAALRAAQRRRLEGRTRRGSPPRPPGAGPRSPRTCRWKAHEAGHLRRLRRRSPPPPPSRRPSPASASTTRRR